MLPKLLALLGVVLQVGEMALAAYDQIRKIIPRGNPKRLTQAEMLEFGKLIRTPALSERERDRLRELRERLMAEIP